MKKEIQRRVEIDMQTYRLPRYEEIPNVGLYLNQVAKYLNTYMEPLGDMCITESMISNYVKKHLVANPVKKQYDRDQIAHLMFIALVKAVLPLNHIQLLMQKQQQVYTSQKAYDYFCTAFEQVLQAVFSGEEVIFGEEKEQNELKQLLSRIIMTLGHQIYLEQTFYKLEEEMKNA